MAQNLIECDRELFEPHDSTRSLVLTLNEIIHSEVRKLYRAPTSRSSTSTFAKGFS